MSRYAKTLRHPALAAAGLLVALSAVSGWAQAQVVATDVRCQPDPCVDTSDIVPGAIVGTVIANQTIGPGKLIPGSINAATIANGSIGPNKLIPGSINAATIATDAIRSNKILDGSVQGADIANGAITFSKLAEDAVFMRTKVVSPIGPSAQDNCDELLATLGGITDNTFNNPYLIVVEPGIYDCGASSVDMKEYVDIRGSGTNTTRITGSVDSLVSGVVNGANNARLSSLTVENSGGGANAIGIFNSSASPDLLDLDVRVLNATSSAIAISNNNAEPQIVRVDALAIGSVATSLAIGILNDASSPNISASEAQASADPGTGTGSELVGMLNRNGSSPDVEQTSSHAEGRLVAASAFGMRNETSSSPSIVWGSTEAEEATGSNIGMENLSGSSPLMALASASGEGGALAIGIRNNAADVTLFTVLVEAIDATSNDAMRNATAPITVTAHNAFFSGADHSIANADAGNIHKLAASQLDGPATTATGTWTCAYAYSGLFVPLNTACQ